LHLSNKHLKFFILPLGLLIFHQLRNWKTTRKQFVHQNPACISLCGFNMINLLFEVFDLIVVLVAISSMYQGIEICHPIYFQLFVNLIITFVSTLFNICVTLIFDKELRQRLVITSNILSLVYVTVSWFVLSVLR
jgi:hypothetical protein